MASESETVADIVAMLRANARGERFDDFSFSSLADRIEAAWKREAVTNCNGLGNAAAMREALKRCEAISHFPEIREQQCVKDMRNIIAHALAAPPRNCDVGTSAEQNNRYEHYCFTHRTMERCCQDCPIKDEPCCELAWSQMPYEAEEGGAK